MFQLLLVIIYLSFIGLGIPDGLLGAMWPTMHVQLKVPIPYISGISIIISFGTIISSLQSNRITRYLGTGKLTVLSIGMTAIAMLGFSVSSAYWQLCLWAIPYGFGAGSVDTALNNYVAIHCKERHLSWMQCMCGLGATVGPYMIAYVMNRGGTWNTGYRVVAVFQMILTMILFLSLPLWKKQSDHIMNNEKIRIKDLTLKGIIQIQGVKEIIICIFCYFGVEQTIGLWISSYLTFAKGISTEITVRCASMYFAGITIGRILCGFITRKIKDIQIICIGHFLMGIGIVMMLLSQTTMSEISLIVAGIGCAPIYPCSIHLTADYFEEEYAHMIIGLQIASAYLGILLMPSLFSIIANYITIALFPVYLLVLFVIMIFTNRRLTQTIQNKE